MSSDLFALERLRQNPDLGYEALRREAESAGVSLHPTDYGSARRQLGLTNAATPMTTTATTTMREGDASAVHQPPKPGPGLSKPSTPAFEFLVEALRAQPTISYGDLKAAAEGKGLRIAPIMYGRAKALLGLVPVRPRGQGKNRKRAAINKLSPAEAASAELFSKQLEAVSDPDDLRSIARQLDAERRRLRSLLEQLAAQINATIH